MDYEYYYTYLIKDSETKEFYIGVRCTNTKPINDNYMGSMKAWSKFKNFNSDNHKKTILSIYGSREEAYESERELITKFINDPLNRNYYIPDKGFGTYGLRGEKSGMYGKKHTDETKAKIRDVRRERNVISNKKMVLDTSTGLFFNTIRECYQTLFNHKKFGTFFHQLKHGKLPNLQIIT